MIKKIITDYEIPEKAFPSIDIKKVKKQEKPPKNKIWNGDCVELLQKVKDKTVDTIFVDPPYNLSKKSSLNLTNSTGSLDCLKISLSSFFIIISS